MSTSTKAMPKPKRPLSGYNLFYRYKRNKVLEATAHPNASDDDHPNKAIIHAVLTALPGLEDVSPVSPIFDLPLDGLNEFRATKIRSAMQGKLFPNENARSRIHCKVHGMGFVEMGRVMRQMWGQADKFTKDVFCELADLGRVRYRRLVAEYKLSGELPDNVESKTPNYQVNKFAETSALKSAQTVNGSKEAAPEGSFPAILAAAAAVDPVTTEATARAEAYETLSIPQQAGSSTDPMLEDPSVWVTKNTPVAVATSSESKKDSRRSCRRPVSFVPSEAQSYDGGRGYLFESLAFKAMMNPTSNVASNAAEKSVRSRYERRMSTAAILDLCGDSLFEPLPVEAREKSVRSRYERLVSTAAILDLCDDSLFEPLPVERAKGPVAMDAFKPNGYSRGVSTDIASQLDWRAMMGNSSWAPKMSSRHGRRVSTDVSPIVNGSMDAASAQTAVAMGNGSASSHSVKADLGGSTTNLELQHIVLRNAIKNIKERIIRNDSLLPSDIRVFPEGGIVPPAQENNVGGKTHLEVMTWNGPSILSSHDATEWAAWLDAKP